MLERIADGRTDLVFEYLAAGNAIDASLIRWCAYYGDVSAIRHLLAHGEDLHNLGGDLGLHAACFHGHWRLVEFLTEQGANVNEPDAATGETPLHITLSSADRAGRNQVLQVLLAHKANPNIATIPGIETGCFMRDCRTKGETPLHRAAAFGDEEAIQLLLDRGAVIDAKDANGDTPLAWASWYTRPTSILRMLCYGDFRIHPRHQSMQANLLGKPSAEDNNAERVTTFCAGHEARRIPSALCFLSGLHFLRFFGFGPEVHRDFG